MVMEEKSNPGDTAGNTYEYKKGEYTVSVSFSSDESLEDCLARYVSKCLRSFWQKTITRLTISLAIWLQEMTRQRSERRSQGKMVQSKEHLIKRHP